MTRPCVLLACEPYYSVLSASTHAVFHLAELSALQIARGCAAFCFMEVFLYLLAGYIWGFQIFFLLQALLCLCIILKVLLE